MLAAKLPARRPALTGTIVPPRTGPAARRVGLGVRLAWHTSRRWLGSRDERWAMAQFTLSGLVAVAVILVLGLVASGRAGRDEAVKNAEEVTRVAAHGVVAPALTARALDGDRAATRAPRSRCCAPACCAIRCCASSCGTPAARSSTRRSAASRARAPNPTPRCAARCAPARRSRRSATPRGPATASPTAPSCSTSTSRSRPPTAAGSSSRPAAGWAPSPTTAASCSTRSPRFSSAASLLLQLVNLPLALRLIAPRAGGAAQGGGAAAARGGRVGPRAPAPGGRPAQRRRPGPRRHVDVARRRRADRQRPRRRGDRGAPGRGRRREPPDDARAAPRARRHLPAEPAARRSGQRARGPARDDPPPRHRGRTRTLPTDLDLDLAPDVAALVFRVVHEALRNVVNHAGADRVELRIEHAAGGELLVHVADDGRGFEPADLPAGDGHVGLALMRDLVEQAGGELAVASAPGAGAVIRARIPLR